MGNDFVEIPFQNTKLPWCSPSLDIWHCSLDKMKKNAYVWDLYDDRFVKHLSITTYMLCCPYCLLLAKRKAKRTKAQRTQWLRYGSIMIVAGNKNLSKTHRTIHSWLVCHSSIYHCGFHIASYPCFDRHGRQRMKNKTHHVRRYDKDDRFLSKLTITVLVNSVNKDQQYVVARLHPAGQQHQHHGHFSVVVGVWWLVLSLSLSLCGEE